jgi:hypothetical protein
MCGPTPAQHNKVKYKYQCFCHLPPFILFYTAPEVVLCNDVSQQQKGAGRIKSWISTKVTMM